MLTNVQSPLLSNGEENEKVIRNYMRIRITTKSWPLLEGHPLPIPANFGRHPFPHSSVILFTEWQMGFQSGFSD